MKPYRICITLLFAASSIAAIAQAPATTEIPAADQASREEVLQLFTAMHLEKQMDQMMRLMNANMKQQMLVTLQRQMPGMSSEQAAKFDAGMDGAMNLFPVSEILDDCIPVYQRHMSKSDVTAISAFYASPAGQHLLVQSPLMMQDIMATVVPKINARVQDYVAKMVKDTEKSGAPVSTSSPATNPQK
ncbi:MAG TPA: DUF2059 domain-containing protein [Acidisarcina sp.]